MFSRTVDGMALRSTFLIESYYIDLNPTCGWLCQKENQMNRALLLELQGMQKQIE